MTMFTPSWTNHFYEMALLVSTRSKDPSTRVGALVVDEERRIVGSGYNGFPRGVDDDPARYGDRPLKLAMVVHAEVNAILNAAKSVRGCVLVSTRAPCSACSGVIIQSGISYVICPDQAANSKWADDWMIAKQMLLEGGVQTEHPPLPRHGATQEEYYEAGLQTLSTNLGWHECSPTCRCPVPDEKTARETMAQLLRGKSV